MENRHGLCVEFSVHNPMAESDPVVAD